MRHRLETKAALGVLRAKPNLFTANYQMLSTLPNGLYSLVKQSDNSEAGYIIVQNDSVFVDVYRRAELFHYELHGIAAYLSDLNTLITPSRTVENRDTVDSERLAGLEPAEVSERLIWYNRTLMAKAAKMLKAEHKAIETAFQAIAAAQAVQKSPTE
jgi:hypothetical protein